MGKSTIIAVASLFALTETDIEEIHLVHPNEYLGGRDRRTFEQFFTISGTQKRIHYHTDLNYESKSNSLTLIDEVDFFMYRDPEKYCEFMRKKRTLGFIATPTDLNSESLEYKTQK